MLWYDWIGFILSNSLIDLIILLHCARSSSSNSCLLFILTSRCGLHRSSHLARRYCRASAENLQVVLHGDCSLDGDTSDTGHECGIGGSSLGGRMMVHSLSF
jgi:hypothetical protein